MILKPRICLEAHESALIIALDENHNITVGLFAFLETLLLDHLRVINEAYEFPLTQMQDSLRCIVCHVDNGNLFVARRECLVGKQWVVYYPRLRYGLLWVVKKFLVIFDTNLSTEHVQFDFTTSTLFEEHRAE